MREEEENMLEKLFHLKENKTTVKTEVTAGITSFFTMAYIIFVNPQILSAAGMDAGAVMLATCVASAIGTFLMTFLANYPFALAPGMGLNAFFAFTICGSMGYSWQAALAAVFISGCLFIIITVTGVREAIVRAIPMELKNAISVGIGFFIAFIGLKNANMLKFTIDPGKYQNFDGTIVADASPIPAFNFASASTLLAIFGLIVLAVLYVRKVKGALFLGILITSAVGCVLQFALGIDVGVTAPTGGISIPRLWRAVQLQRGCWLCADVGCFGADFSGTGRYVRHHRYPDWYSYPRQYAGQRGQPAKSQRRPAGRRDCNRLRRCSGYLHGYHLC